jgi:penicillin-binding protein 1C
MKLRGSGRWIMPLPALCAVRAGGARRRARAEQVRREYRGSEAQLLDRHGELIQSLRIDLQGRRADWVALGDISPALPAAVLQAEDQRFYQHEGVDWSAAGKAAWDNLFRSRPRGASTITMQLAALLDPRLQASRQGRSWAQKWDQVQAARELDASWSRRRSWKPI